MTDKFELLCLGISQVQKKIQKIKKMHMNSFGLKGTHVMCIYFLNHARDGLTAAELCGKCGEDKAGISRTLAELEEQGLITYARNGQTDASAPGRTEDPSAESGTKTGKAPALEQRPAARRYRARAYLTDAGVRKADTINRWAAEAVDLGSMGITAEEEEIFYRILLRISDNLDRAIRNAEEEHEQV